MLTIYHKSNCSTSIQVLNMIKNSGKKFKIIEYLKTPPDADEIKVLLEKLAMPAEQLIRKKEPIFKENYAGKKLSEKQCIDILVEHPILIERPILVKTKHAIIGRPPEIVAKFIK